MTHRRAALSLLVLSVASGASGASGSRAASQESVPPAAGAPYVRLVEEADGRLLCLEVAARRFAPEDGTGPEVLLAGAIHIAEPSFYRTLQELLDARDVVLFESVKPAGTGDPAHDRGVRDDAARVRITIQRQRLVALFLESWFDEHGRYPADLGELARGLTADRALLLEVAADDGWGRPLELVVVSRARRGKFDLVSLGADEREGGEGVAADLFFSDQPAISAAELGQGGLQKELAQAMRLVFQLDAMDHAGAQWLNADLAMDQITERLGQPQSPDELFGLLSGESLMARMGTRLLRLVGSTAGGSAALQLVGIELLSRSEEILATGSPLLGNLLEVLIQDRNAVVLEELRAIVSAEREGGDRAGAIERVGVLYGVAHLADLEQRLCAELGYAPAGEEWLRAVELDLDELGIGRTQVGWIRRTIQGALDLQLGD